MGWERLREAFVGRMAARARGTDSLAALGWWLAGGFVLGLRGRWVAGDGVWLSPLRRCCSIPCRRDRGLGRGGRTASPRWVGGWPAQLLRRGVNPPRTADAGREPAFGVTREVIAGSRRVRLVVGRWVGTSCGKQGRLRGSDGWRGFGKWPGRTGRWIKQGLRRFCPRRGGDTGTVARSRSSTINTALRATARNETGGLWGRSP